jgi:hypothetical protein
MLWCGVQVNLNSVWSGMGLMENNLLGAQQETRLRVEELEDRWARLLSALQCLDHACQFSATLRHCLPVCWLSKQ